MLKTRMKLKLLKGFFLILFFLILFFFIRKNYFENKNLVELNSIYSSIVKYELKRDSTFSIVDEASGRTYKHIEGFESVFENKIERIFWRKDMFSEVQYFNSDSLNLYRNLLNSKDIRFEDFFINYKSNWIINLSEPLLNKEEDKAIIDVSFLNPEKDSVYSRLYALKKISEKYKVINFRDSRGASFGNRSD